MQNITPIFHDLQTNLDRDPQERDLIIRKRQELPADFLSTLRGIKADSTDQREDEFMLAASIPVIVVEELLKEGFDVMREPIRETLKKLREKGLDGFITTNKRV